MSIDTVKAAADKLAEMHAAVCIKRTPNLLQRLLIKPNYKFFRRLAGLAGRDATEKTHEDRHL